MTPLRFHFNAHTHTQNKFEIVAYLSLELNNMTIVTHLIETTSFVHAKYGTLYMRVRVTMCDDFL